MPTLFSLPTSPAACALPVVEMLGRVALSQIDLAQRMQFLASRLSIGLVESYLRKHVRQVDETFYAADLAEIEGRTALLMEAGTEGMVTIMRSYIEEVTQAQIGCVAASLSPALSGEATAQLLAYSPPRHGVPLRREARVSARG